MPKTATVLPHRQASLPSLRDLMNAGAHFGHRKERSKPAARKYTFLVRDGVCVINLEETQRQLELAAKVLADATKNGQTILLVGTKRQAQPVIQAMAERLGLPFVTQRWLGGTLTNFEVIRKNVKRLTDTEKILADEIERAKYTKRERLQMEETVRKLHANLDGITKMTNLPDFLLVVDPHEEKTAVSEATRLEIPVVAICDTDCDPETIDVPILANDDAPKTIELILNYLADALAMSQGKETSSKTKAKMSNQAQSPKSE